MVSDLLDAFVALHTSKSKTSKMVEDKAAEMTVADLSGRPYDPDPRVAFRRNNPTTAAIPACVRASCAMVVAFPDIGDSVIQICDEEAAAIASGERKAPPKGTEAGTRSLFG